MSAGASPGCSGRSAARPWWQRELGAADGEWVGAGRPSLAFICSTCRSFSSRAHCNRACLRSSWPSSTRRPPTSGEPGGPRCPWALCVGIHGLAGTCSALQMLLCSLASLRPGPGHLAGLRPTSCCRCPAQTWQCHVFTPLCLLAPALSCMCWSAGVPSSGRPGGVSGELQSGPSHCAVSGHEPHTRIPEGATGKQAARWLSMTTQQPGACRDLSLLFPRRVELGVCTMRRCRG